MTAAPTIRQLTEADAAPYRDLRLHLLRVSPDLYGTTYEEARERPVAQTAARLREQQDPDLGFTLGAFTGDPPAELVGMLTLLRGEGTKSRHKGTVYGMGVAEVARGRGIGGALVAAAIERAHRMPGLEQLLLTVVLPNEAALRLYRAHGFVTYGIDRRGLKLGDRYWDEEQMIRVLSAEC